MATNFQTFDQSKHGMFCQSPHEFRNGDGGTLWNLEIIAYGDNTPPDATGGEAEFAVQCNGGDWGIWRPCPSLPGGQGLVVAIVTDIPDGTDINLKFRVGEDDGYLYEVTNYVFPADGGINWAPPPPAKLLSAVVAIGEVFGNLEMDVLIDIIAKP